MSRKPPSPLSCVWLPTVRNFVGTPFARPTVYWMSRDCHGVSTALAEEEAQDLTASTPAAAAPCGLMPPSSASTSNVAFAFPARSGRNLVKKLCTPISPASAPTTEERTFRSVLSAYWPTNPLTPIAFFACVAGAVGRPYSCCTHFGVIACAQLCAASASTAAAGSGAAMRAACVYGFGKL
jgi:hypothetical protein